MQKVFIAYLRVSTIKQGETGVSLSEQRLAIEYHAKQHGLHISEWHTETQSAASRRRPVFDSIVKKLESGQVHGLIVHKIDRGARNLGDWAKLGELLDRGVDIRFVHDGLDLRSRGGRLAADIQAVIAADFIRNLRDEARKGMYGRLRQGLYPFGAPIGYLDNGRGKVKTLDPIRAPLLREAFELYASGRRTLHSIRVQMHGRGLRNLKGGPISIGGWSNILKNSFYVGRLELKTTGEVFLGVHQPLVSQQVFEGVREVLRRRRPRTTRHRHFFRYRGLLRCSTCGSTLIGEKQKAHIYYRCHMARCAQRACLREDRVNLDKDCCSDKARSENIQVVHHGSKFDSYQVSARN